jgi:hypothetical protein
MNIQGAHTIETHDWGIVVRAKEPVYDLLCRGCIPMGHEWEWPETGGCGRCQKCGDGPWQLHRRRV